MKKRGTFELILCGIFAALTAVLSQILVPIGPVPINLAHISVFTAAGLLGGRYGALSQVVFVCLGAFGVPVFAGLRGGPGVIAGPTGGFIFGFIGCAFVSGAIIHRFGTSAKALFSAMVFGMFVSYLLGVPWFMHYMGAPFSAEFVFLFLLPFIPGDALKMAASALLIRRLYPTVSKMRQA